MQVQTKEEVAAIVNQWVDLHAPKDLSQTDHNAGLIADFIVKKCGGFFSFSNLSRAVIELGDLATGGVLQFHSLPKDPKEIARDKRDFLAKMGIITNSASWKADPSEQHSKSKARIAARQSAAQDRLDGRSRRQIEAAISGYSAYRSGRLSHALTEQRRSDLRKIAVHSDGQFDAAKTLALVREAIRTLPD